ncbi:MAG: NAD-dependent epimerase/dehydratase family protein [Clostridia bacterium]|nr:MAG: NAD-dependent epimerase/dehydratase family protein [Clostridia bacterium]
MATCVVTGVAGFIGSTLAERLLAMGHQVRGVDCLSPSYDPLLKERSLADLKTQAGFQFFRLDLVEGVWTATKAGHGHLPLHEPDHGGETAAGFRRRPAKEGPYLRGGRGEGQLPGHGKGGRRPGLRYRYRPAGHPPGTGRGHLSGDREKGRNKTPCRAAWGCAGDQGRAGGFRPLPGIRTASGAQDGTGAAVGVDVRKTEHADQFLKGTLFGKPFSVQGAGQERVKVTPGIFPRPPLSGQCLPGYGPGR